MGTRVEISLLIAGAVCRGAGTGRFLENSLMETLVYTLDIFGVAVFAITGSLAAGRKHMDLFGVVVLASVTALGGGTLRDLILGAVPVFWVGAPSYLAVAVVMAIATFFFVRFCSFQDFCPSFTSVIGPC